jgi:hypothetical protein
MWIHASTKTSKQSLTELHLFASFDSFEQAYLRNNHVLHCYKIPWPSYSYVQNNICSKHRDTILWKCVSGQKCSECSRRLHSMSTRLQSLRALALAKGHVFKAWWDAPVQVSYVIIALLSLTATVELQGPRDQHLDSDKLRVLNVLRAS